MKASDYDGRVPEPPYPTPHADRMQRKSEIDLILALLATLIEVREVLAAKLEDQATSVDYFATDDPLIQRMDAAIAKAKGQS